MRNAPFVVEEIDGENEGEEDNAGRRDFMRHI